MKGLVWHCDKVSWVSEGVEESQNHCVLVFCCFEQGDTVREVSEAARRIRQLNSKRFHEASVVIFPFAHLSSDIMSVDAAEKCITLLAHKLVMAVETVKIMPFNQDKAVQISLLEKNEDVSFFEY